MKKKLILLCSLFLFFSCLDIDDNAPNFTYEYLTVDEAITPTSFTFGETASITVKYTLPNCHYFDRLYYESQGTTKIVAITALVSLDNTACTQAIIHEEYTFPVTVDQQEDYVFKFWKGKDDQGNDTYEEVVIPVN